MRLLKDQRIPWLTPEELKAVHQGSCRLLSQIGVKVTHERIARLLADSGAHSRGSRMCIPEHLVDKALSDTAKVIDFNAPDPNKRFTVDAAADEVRFGTGGQALYVVHRTADGWEKRPAVTGDLRQILTLCDQLDQADFVTRPVECDVPEEQMDIEKAKLFRAHCTKPMNLANLVHTKNLDGIIEVIGDQSYLSFIVCLVASPLSMDTSAGDKLLALVEKGLPAALSSCPQAGSTAPFSEVGELIQLNAELLFGIVLANTIRPGAKVLYRGIPITSDLYTDGSPRWCQPESIRRVAIAAQISRWYGIPCCGTAGVSDQGVPNAQGLSEKILSWSVMAASGAHYINSALGMLQQVMSVSPYQYVIDDAALRIVKEELTASPQRSIGDTVLASVQRAFSYFGTSLDEPSEQEMRSRIAHVETAKEPYDEAYMNKQIESIEKAVARESGSSIFMKGARKGLREGYLYTGESIPAELDLEKVRKRLASYAPEGGEIYE